MICDPAFMNHGEENAVRDCRRVSTLKPLAGWRTVVCMPACDEEHGIASSLVSVLGQLTGEDALVLVVNGSSDRTAMISENLLSSSGHQFTLIDLQWKQGCGSAPRARRIALDIGARAAPEGFLLSIDADTVAASHLRQAYDAEFAAGSDLVCGAIDFDPLEAVLLPPVNEYLEFVVREYRAVSREIDALLDPDPDNPWPHHGNIGGANFAIRTQAYRLVGGLPIPDFGEERALLRLVQAHGLRIRFSDRARVTTSCRLTGKAPGGLADELRRSRLEADPLMDEALEPATTLKLRARSRSALRCSADDRMRRLALEPLGLSAADLSAAMTTRRWQMAWQHAEASSLVLTRRRMRRSDLQRELPALIALRDNLRSGEDDRS